MLNWKSLVTAALEPVPEPERRFVTLLLHPELLDAIDADPNCTTQNVADSIQQENLLGYPYRTDDRMPIDRMLALLDIDEEEMLRQEEIELDEQVEEDLGPPKTVRGLNKELEKLNASIEYKQQRIRLLQRFEDFPFLKSEMHQRMIEDHRRSIVPLQQRRVDYLAQLKQQN